MQEPKSLMTILWSAVWLALAALVVGTLLLNFVSANWGWLLLAAGIVTGIAALIAWIRWRISRW